MLISEMKMFYGHLRTEQGRRHQQRDPGWTEQEQPETRGFSGSKRDNFHLGNLTLFPPASFQLWPG